MLFCYSSSGYTYIEKVFPDEKKKFFTPKITKRVRSTTGQFQAWDNYTSYRDRIILVKFVH